MKLVPKEIIACPEDEKFLAYVFFKDDSRYISLARYTDQDTDDGVIYVEREDQAYSTENGIIKCTLTMENLIIEFAPAAAKDLGGLPFVKIDLKDETLDFDLLKKTLNRIFRGRNEFQHKR